MQHQTTHPIQTHQLLLPARAAIYARVSSDQQAERQTIGSQVSDLLARAAAEGRDIGEEFRFLDDGQSGASLVRPALERLRDLVAMSAIEVVYVHAPDRLARSYAHQAVLIEEFARAGTQVVFLNRPIGQSPEDNLLLQLQGMFAEYERARMLERSRRGKRYLAQVGSVSVLSRAPYGYGFVGRGAGGGVARFEVIEEKAQVVRQIFRRVGHERVSLSAVSRRLFEAGVPSPTGNAHWSRSMLWTLLSNPAYAGQAVFGKNTSIPWRPPLRPARGRARVPKRPFRQIPASREHWVRIAVPAIIEAELFESAQEAAGREPAPPPATLRRRTLPAARTAGLPQVWLRLLWALAAALSSRTGPRVSLLSLLGDREPSVPWSAPVRCSGHARRAAGHGGVGADLSPARGPRPRSPRVRATAACSANWPAPGRA